MEGGGGGRAEGGGRRGASRPARDPTGVLGGDCSFLDSMVPYAMVALYHDDIIHDDALCHDGYAAFIAFQDMTTFKNRILANFRWGKFKTIGKSKSAKILQNFTKLNKVVQKSSKFIQNLR